ncbi:MAG TPA: helix-turn-helix domain-containing protein, partial [Methanocorpusculum sp.]|nr:helix-turn-helix domain-containing protein [Methanocorpusculum sp.]
MSNLFRIGEFSKLGKTSIKTLRYYDECGLLKPDKIDRFNNYRYYSTAQLFTLYRIQSLRAAGLSISEIADVLSGADEVSILRQKRKELQDDLAQIKRRIAAADYLLVESGSEKISMYSAVIKEIPECIVFAKIGCT